MKLLKQLNKMLHTTLTVISKMKYPYRKTELRHITNACVLFLKNDKIINKSIRTENVFFNLKKARTTELILKCDSDDNFLIELNSLMNFDIKSKQKLIDTKFEIVVFDFELSIVHFLKLTENTLQELREDSFYLKTEYACTINLLDFVSCFVGISTKLFEYFANLNEYLVTKLSEVRQDCSDLRITNNILKENNRSLESNKTIFEMKIKEQKKIMRFLIIFGVVNFGFAMFNLLNYIINHS